MCFTPSDKEFRTNNRLRLQNEFNKQVSEDINNIATELNSVSSGGEGMIESVNGQTGVVVLDKSDIGLSNVDNTSDVDKPVSTEVQSALDSINEFVGLRYAEIQALETQVNNLAPIVENLEDIVITNDIAGAISTMLFNITTLQGDIQTILNQISDLDARITTLENP